VSKPYPPEFRRRALDLVASGRSVREVAAMLGIAESCLHRWKSRDLVDRGLKSPTPEQAESAAVRAAQDRITELENEVKILRKAAAAAGGGGAPKARLALVGRTGR
jgi:transposase-like protein